MCSIALRRKKLHCGCAKCYSINGLRELIGSWLALWSDSLAVLSCSIFLMVAWSILLVGWGGAASDALEMVALSKKVITAKPPKAIMTKRMMW